MTHTLWLEPSSNTAARSVLIGGSAMITGDRPGPRSMPASIPASQVYYWTNAWQDGEQEALDDLEAGRSEVFEDPQTLARYLLRPGG